MGGVQPLEVRIRSGLGSIVEKKASLHKGDVRRRSARARNSGQSLVELSILVLLLMLIVAGIAEYGMLLNHYLNIIDGAREAARYNSNFNPFCPINSADPFCPPGEVTPDYYESTAEVANQVIYPIELNPNQGDDIVVSFFTVEGGAITGRYPLEHGQQGWSWSENLGAYGVRNESSRQDSSFILSKMDPSAPDVSVSLVEIFYNYPQTLRLPVFTEFIDDPISVYTFAVFPIKNVSPPSP